MHVKLHEALQFKNATNPNGNRSTFKYQVL